MKIFISSSFQASVLFYGYYSELKMKFKHYIIRRGIINYRTYYMKESFKLMSTDLKCTKKPIVLCAFNFHVPRGFYVNITLVNFNYSGPNTEYCKYGGLSIYDYITNNMKEILLLCDNWFPMSSKQWAH